jgi:hypothetical protein
MPIVQAQSVRYIKGKVYERIGGKTEACPGVNVYIANEQNRSLIGTTTNVNGEYSLKVPVYDGKMKVMFTFIGMKASNLSIRSV